MTAKRHKSAVALVLAAGLVVLGIHGWVRGTATAGVLLLIAVGVVLAVLYAFRGGTLPDAAHRYAKVHADDDERHLSPRVYLPILLAAVFVATVLYLWTVKR